MTDERKKIVPCSECNGKGYTTEWINDKENLCMGVTSIPCNKCHGTGQLEELMTVRDILRTCSNAELAKVYKNIQEHGIFSDGMISHQLDITSPEKMEENLTSWLGKIPNFKDETSIFNLVQLDSRKNAKNVKNVFISVGMSGRSEVDIMDDIHRAESNIWHYFKGCVDFVVTTHNYSSNGPEGCGSLWYLGGAIRKMDDCNACYFCKGWQNHRGCVIEHHICEAYGIEIIEEE